MKDCNKPQFVGASIARPRECQKQPSCNGSFSGKYMRDVQAEQYKGRAEHALKRHRFAQKHDPKERGEDGAERAEKPRALAA